MKKLIFLILTLAFTNVVNAALVQYQFVGGNLEPDISFTLEVDYSLDGYFTNGDGSLGAFDASRNTFFVNYQSGNYALAPSTNLFSRNYGEDGATLEGIESCMYALNSIGICGSGPASNWVVGNTFKLSLFDSMGSFDTSVRLESISSVPLPASLLLFLSGITALLGFRKRI